jgi:regulator of Ty1 transposition protein 109
MVTPKHPNGDPSSLVDQLSRVLPKDVKFTAHHLSTPPTPTEPLCYPPSFPDKLQDGDPGLQIERRARKPLRTYCEKHFLAISIHTPDTDEQVLVLGIEIYIYTTAHTSILFVCKADSTGYLGLLALPKGTPSPIREITTTFVSYLVANRRRKGIQFVVNLFARAQSQYLFPGSVKNNGKHVLDDRGLVKWWCRVLNPLLEERGKGKSTWDNIHAYLIIPGLDDYETRAFLPRAVSTATSWTLGHPLENISPYSSDPGTYGSNIPPRCLIPTYPDDPKARFVEELEDSTSERLKLVGGWKSPKTLDQFWEMMAFRQECSSGRMTGFIWLVFDPPSTSRTANEASTTLRSAAAYIQSPNTSFSAPTAMSPTRVTRPLTPEPSQNLVHEINPNLTPLKSTQSTPAKPPPKAKKPKKIALKGRIVPRQPRVKTQQRTHFPKLTETAHYSWPEEGRGKVVLDDSGYKRAVELLLHLEFGTLKQAITSSTRWTNEVNGSQDWSFDIVGQRETPVQTTIEGSNKAVNDLSGMFKRKRPATDAATDAPAVTAAEAPVNNLAGLVRKKAKVAADVTPAAANDSEPKVNTLGAGLVRKKAKPT